MPTTPESSPSPLDLAAELSRLREENAQLSGGLDLALARMNDLEARLELTAELAEQANMGGGGAGAELGATQGEPMYPGWVTGESSANTDGPTCYADAIYDAAGSAVAINLSARSLVSVSWSAVTKTLLSWSNHVLIAWTRLFLTNGASYDGDDADDADQDGMKFDVGADDPNGVARAFTARSAVVAESSWFSAGILGPRKENTDGDQLYDAGCMYANNFVTTMWAAGPRLDPSGASPSSVGRQFAMRFSGRSGWVIYPGDDGLPQDYVTAFDLHADAKAAFWHVGAYVLGKTYAFGSATKPIMATAFHDFAEMKLLGNRMTQTAVLGGGVSHDGNANSTYTEAELQAVMNDVTALWAAVRDLQTIADTHGFAKK